MPAGLIDKLSSVASLKAAEAIAGCQENAAPTNKKLPDEARLRLDYSGRRGIAGNHLVVAQMASPAGAYSPSSTATLALENRL